MARGKVVTVKGLKELDKSLQELTKATARNVLRRTLKKSAEPFADEMQHRAPVESGELERSVSYSGRAPKGHKPGTLAFRQAKMAGLSNKRAGKIRSFINRLGLPWVEGFVGPGRNPQAIMQEFGTVNHGPQPFARPTWDSGKTRLLARIRGHLKTEVWKSVKRARAKALRAKR